MDKGTGWTRGRDGDGTACPCCTMRSPLQLSVVEYDPGTHDLKTLSLHYFEEPELRVGVGLGAGDGSWGAPGGPITPPPPPFFATRRTALCRTCTSPKCGWTPTGAAP